MFLFDYAYLIYSLLSELQSIFRKRFKSNVNISHLKPSTAHGLLKHAVTVLLAHIGFDRASDCAIATLTDSADFFLRRIALLLKTASEEKNYGFPVRNFSKS